MEYIYSLYDPQTNKLLYSGTPEQLVKKPQPKAKPEGKDETPLQRDVHRMCLYNKAALKAGKKELQYGYWAAAGKPEAPVW